MVTSTPLRPPVERQTDRAAPVRPEDGPGGQRRLGRPWEVVALLTVLGLGVRLVIVRGFWLDEATSGYDARLSYPGMLHQLLHDNHPPLEYTILWLTAHTIGSSQTDLRLPSILVGTLLIPMVFVAGRALFDERTGVVAAAFTTVGALAVWYAQEARMYPLFMLLATVTIWAQKRALDTDQGRYWWAWGAASVALLWTQWFSSLAVGAEVLFFLGTLWVDRRERGWRRPLAHLTASVAGVLVCLAPIVPLLLTQYSNNQANGLGFSSGSSPSFTASLSPYGIFNNLAWATFGYHSAAVIAAAVAIWPIGLLAVLAVLGRSRASKRSNRQLLVVGFLPMALVFVGSAAAASGRSLFEIRYFIELVPVLYLLLACAACNLTPGDRTRRIATGAVLVAFTAGLVLQQTDSANPRLYGYDAAFRQIESVARPGAEILYAPSYLNVDVAYFAPHLTAAPVTGRAPDRPLADQIFVLTSLDFAGASPAATDRLVSQLDRSRHLDATFTAPNVRVREYS